ncbi:MAG: ATP phosphoribosyltransferase regulatory subunit [Clostridia bacterium]|nr:ATP phosphoribosyltransferase regulatory subunit [Clostridia bacterium]
MIDFDKVLTPEERTVFTLRGLYREYGYQQYKMSKFEEYDLYAKNKDFLVSDGVITFNDKDGRLLALKPDVTLSIIKNSKDTGGVQKVFYNENVYRAEKGTGSFKEIMQTGIEYIGRVGSPELSEVITLAVRSLAANTRRYVLELADMDVLEAFLSCLGISERGCERILECLREKNASGAASVVEDEGGSQADAALISELVKFHCPASVAEERLSLFIRDDATEAAVGSFVSVLRELIRAGVADSVFVDFSVVNNTRYYNGIAFRGFAEGAPSAVLLGGRYDKLMRRMKREACAVGFAVYVDELARAGREND